MRCLISDAKDWKNPGRVPSTENSSLARTFGSRLNEDIFADLYSDKPSRPNIPVNVLAGFETLKAGFGYSDEEMYAAYSYDMQIRYAFGYRNLGEGEFELRTIYNFRRRLSEYMQEKGINLIEKAFEQVSDEQIEAFQLKTGKLRMDSTQIASNIRETSRLPWSGSSTAAG